MTVVHKLQKKLYDTKSLVPLVSGTTVTSGFGPHEPQQSKGTQATVE
jgi:hypothetical protein